MGSRSYRNPRKTETVACEQAKIRPKSPQPHRRTSARRCGAWQSRTGMSGFDRLELIGALDRRKQRLKIALFVQPIAVDRMAIGGELPCALPIAQGVHRDTEKAGGGFDLQVVLDVHGDHPLRT